MTISIADSINSSGGGGGGGGAVDNSCYGTGGTGGAAGTITLTAPGSSASVQVSGGLFAITGGTGQRWISYWLQWQHLG